MPTVPDLPPEPTTEKLSRRQRLAEVVLTNAPMPHRICFLDPDDPGKPGDKLTLRFDILAELKTWAALFLPDAEIHTMDDDNDTMFASVDGEWGGHPLALYARWPVNPRLDPDRRAQLLAIANAPADAPPVDCYPDAPDAEVTEVGGETVEDAEVTP